MKERKPKRDYHEKVVVNATPEQLRRAVMRGGAKPRPETKPAARTPTT